MDKLKLFYKKDKIGYIFSVIIIVIGTCFLIYNILKPVLSYHRYFDFRGVLGDYDEITEGNVNFVIKDIVDAEKEKTDEDFLKQLYWDCMKNIKYKEFSDSWIDNSNTEWVNKSICDVFSNLKMEGACYHKAAVFGKLAKEAGFPVYMVYGKTKYGAKESTHHWVEINGKIYDPTFDTGFVSGYDGLLFFGVDERAYINNGYKITLLERTRL